MSTPEEARGDRIEFLATILTDTTQEVAYENPQQWFACRTSLTLRDDVIGKLAQAIDKSSEDALPRLQELFTLSNKFSRDQEYPSGSVMMVTTQLMKILRPVCEASLADQVAAWCASCPVDAADVGEYLSDCLELYITDSMTPWINSLAADFTPSRFAYALEHYNELAGYLDDTLPCFRNQRDAMRELAALVANSTSDDAKKLFALMVEHKAMEVHCIDTPTGYVVLPTMPFPFVL